MLVESFFDQQHEGEFSLLNFSVSVVRDYEFPSREQLSGDKLLQAVMDSTVLFHEYRHYHDLVGTPCGFHVMLHVTRLVDRFLKICYSEGQGSISAPVRKSAPHSPLVALYDEYQSFLRAICGDLTPDPGPDDGNLMRVRKVSALGLEMAVPMVLVTDIDPRTGAGRDRYVPLGMRALMEAIAVETQVFLSVVGAGDPDTVNDEEMRARGERALMLGSQILRGGFLIPYAVCSLQYHYATRNFPFLSSLTALSDAALTYSGFSEMAYPGAASTFDHPGIVFMHFLQEWVTTSDQRGDLPLTQLLNETAQRMDLPEYGAVLQDIAGRAETDPDSLAPEALLPRNAVSGHVRRIRGYLFRDFARIMKRKAADPEKWLIAPNYLQHYEFLPRPPLVAVAGEQVSAGRGKGETVDWILWVFLLAMITDLMEHNQVTCPVPDRFPALGQIFSFPDPASPGAATNCTRFIEKKCCGRYDGHFKPGQPDCPFTMHVTRVLNTFKFDRIEFAPASGGSDDPTDRRPAVAD